MLRPARPGDEPALEAFLAAHAETSMFLRSNLADFGLDRGSDDPRATRYWIGQAGGRISAVFGLSNAGFAMSQAPGAAPALYADFAARVAGRRLSGIAGEAGQVVAMKAALGADRVAYGLDEPEPLYRLELSALRAEGLAPGALRTPTEADRALLVDWTRAYSAELHMSPPDRLDAEGRARAERALASGDARLLELDGRPVAMTAVNSRLPDMVQIGGVYTPPGLRGRGYARTAVARHMQELRAEGVATAILFASGAPACRAYEAIGFRHIGTYSLAILAEPMEMVA